MCEKQGSNFRYPGVPKDVVMVQLDPKFQSDLTLTHKQTMIILHHAVFDIH